MICALALVLAAPAFAGEGTPGLQSQSVPQPQPIPRPAPPAKPAIDMDALLRELRDLDSSQDMDGDHAVGEQLC